MLVKERRRKRDSKRLSKGQVAAEEGIFSEKTLEEEPHPKQGGDSPKFLSCQGSRERLKHLNENRKSLLEDMQWDQDALEKIIEKYKVL